MKRCWDSTLIMVTQTFFLSISIYLPTVLFIPGQQNSTSVEEAHSMNVRISGDFNTCSPPLKGFKFLCYMEGEGQWVRLVEKKQHTVAKHAPRFTMLFKTAGFCFFFWFGEHTECVHVINIRSQVSSNMFFSRIYPTVQALVCNSQRRAMGIFFSGPIWAHKQ